MTNQQSNKNELKGYVFALVATALWSGNFIVVRDLSESVPPVSLAFWRWTVAVVIFSPFALKFLIKDWKLLKKHVPYLVITSFLGVTIFNTLIYIAGHTTTAINLSLISITFPIFIIIISRFIFKELITVKKVLGIFLVAVGVLLIITKGSLSILLALSFYEGDIWMLGASLIFATYSILLQKKPKGLNVYAFQLSTFLLGIIFLFPFYIWEYASTPTLTLNFKSVSSILYIGVFSSLIAFILWNKAILLIGSTKSGMIYYTLPLFSGVLAYFILKEDLKIVHLISAVLIIFGIVLSNYKSNKLQRTKSSKE